MSKSKELTVLNPAYDRVVDPLAFAQQMGRQIALSKMFGCETEAQGIVMAWECMARRMPPLTLAERYHVIFGKLSLKAEAMLSDFRSQLGGNFKIIERSADRAAVELALKGESRVFSLTWEEAKQEPFVYEGKEDDKVAMIQSGNVGKLRIKAKYATPRSRFQMLWARVVSDGVGAMAPEIRAGRYTPEEVSDFEELPGGGNSTVDVIDTEVVQPVVDAPAEPEKPAKPAATGEATYATAAQVNRIIDLLAAIGATHEQMEGMKQRRNVTAWRSLTSQQADELLVALEAKCATVKAMDGASKLPETAQSAAVDLSPCSQARIDEAKNLIKQVQQNGDPKMAEKVAGRLKEAGLAKLADLTMSECDRLITALGMKNMELFFGHSLVGHAKSQAPAGSPPAG